MYDKGQGVPQDYGKADRWYRMAAEQGMPRNSRNNERSSSKQVPRDAVLSWVAEVTEEEWLEDAGVMPAEAA